MCRLPPARISRFGESASPYPMNPSKPVRVFWRRTSATSPLLLAMTRSCNLALIAAALAAGPLVVEAASALAAAGAAGGAGGDATVTEAVVELFSRFDPGLVVVTTARLVRTEPGRTSASTFTTITKVAVAPAPKEAMVLVMTLGCPGEGLVEVHPGAPELETKVVLSGRSS